METNTLFKDALSNIGKQVKKMPEEYSIFINKKFSKISYGKKFSIINVVGQENERVKTLEFDIPKDTENFKGIEFLSKKLYVLDTSNSKQYFGNFSITYHRDLDMWDYCLHVYSDDNSFNLVSINNEINIV